MLKFKTGWLLIIFFFLQTLGAQNAPKREWAIFHKGVQDYQNKDYKRAVKNFRTVIARLHDSRLLTANYLMLAKTLYKQGDYQASLDTCRSFLKKYHQSNYTDDIFYVQANDYYRLERLQSAVSSWLYVAEKSQDVRLKKKALRLAEQVMNSRMNKHDLINMKRESSDDFARQVILYYLAERYYQEENQPAALSALNELQSLKDGNEKIFQKARQLQNYLGPNQKNIVRIAALLPLSGASAEMGKAILDGARLALEQFNRRHGPVIELIPYDYGTRLVNALTKIKEISADASIRAVFGPLENDITAACSAVADYEKLPLITPTSTESDLRRLSSHVVQLAIPQDVSARKLAMFAEDSLHLKRFVTLAPSDEYFTQLTKLFINRIEEGGGQVISRQWYYPEDRNITNYFKNIKRAGLRQAFRDSVMRQDTLLTVSQADSLYVLHLKYEREQLRETHTKLDSADIPVKSIDAVFAPIYKTDISMIASQFAYWNIQAHLLGNGDWYAPKMLKKNKSYINGLIFISDGYLNRESWDYKKFRNDFRNTFKRSPEKLELIGFDSFNFILSALDGKTPADVQRTNFLDLLINAPLYNGVYRTFDIGKKRFNNASRILKYTYGQILPLN